ncbi:MAG: hypothetical protein AAGF12_41000, partial [Myxococcota bacterium]
MLAIAMVGGGCAMSVNDIGTEGSNICAARGCDTATERFQVDMVRANAEWPDEVAAETPAELMRVRVQLGDQTVWADTHMFGDELYVIPYHNDDNVQDAEGNSIARGDAAIAEHFQPGDIGIAVKHHRNEFRTLVLEGGDPDTMKEHFKLQDTHIGIVVGVERDGAAGAITLNNPQTYEDGRFGDANYPMIFLRPSYPEYLDATQTAAFQDNIRTMAAAFNAVSNFPGDYNGGDPLGARNPDEVRELVAQMVRAVAGDTEAREWFRATENLIYCAELAFLAMTAGMHFPLNEATIAPLVGDETWQAFVAQLEAHNAGETNNISELNNNDLADLVDLTVAPDDLRAAWVYAPAESGAEHLLAFQPFTMADIVRHFMSTHLPRSILREDNVHLQGAALTAMKPGLLEAMSLDQVPLMTPEEIAQADEAMRAPLAARAAVEDLFDRLVAVISVWHPTYDDFRAALDPLMEEARRMTGPRDATGTGLFVPPSIFHV